MISTFCVGFHAGCAPAQVTIPAINTQNNPADTPTFFIFSSSSALFDCGYLLFKTDTYINITGAAITQICCQFAMA